MDRVIEFRVWMKNNDHPEGKMYYGSDTVRGRTMLMNLYGDLITTSIERYVYDEGTMARARWANNEITLMQYTGVKDTEGIKIWEGDIVKGKYDGTVERGYTGFPVRGTVKMVGARWAVDWNERGFDASTPLDYMMEHRVIGNKFENPKLLLEGDE